ncbi:MAG TPA: hypothetical protein VJ783_10970 [Pirellulales bacterium]|nr:hypothetical protein [Pirellulales bacterium]
MASIADRAGARQLGVGAREQERCRGFVVGMVDGLDDPLGVARRFRDDEVEVVREARSAQKGDFGRVSRRDFLKKAC